MLNNQRSVLKHFDFDFLRFVQVFMFSFVCAIYVLQKHSNERKKMYVANNKAK